MEIVGTNLAEIEEFILSITEEEKLYYDIRWDILLKQALYIRDYRHNDELIGIASVCRKYFIAYTTPLFVKKAYWGKGIGTQELADSLSWMKRHRIPYDIFLYDARNVATRKMHVKMGLKDMQIGDMYYNVVPLQKYMTFLRYPLFGLIWCHYILCKRGWRHLLSKMKLKSTFLKLAIILVDYNAESLLPSDRVTEYGYAISRLTKNHPGKALDVGCTARQNVLPLTLCLLGWEIYGIDKRRWRFNHSQFHFIEEDVRHMSAPDETYNYVYAISTIEHIGLRSYYRNNELDVDGDIKAVQEIRRVLKLGGKFIITVPYAKYYSKSRGTRHYDANRLEQLIDGFKLVDKSFYIIQDGRGKLKSSGEENAEKEGIVLLELQK